MADGDTPVATDPPGPDSLPIVGNTHQYVRDPLGFFERIASEYGPVARYELGGDEFVQVSAPEHVGHVLVDANDRYVKGDRFQEALRPPLGNGLLTNEGEFWRSQRHTIEPAFHPRQLDRYAEVMVAYTERLLDDWADGEVRNVHEDMMGLTVEIAAKALFDVDVRDQREAVGDALEAVMDHVERSASRPIDVPHWLPTPGNREYQRALSALESIADRIIDERADSAEGDDVVSRLLDAEDGRVTRTQIRDEVITLLLAGHETTALALTYTLFLLATHPEETDSLRADLDAVLGDDAPGTGGRSPTPEDLDDLRSIERVVNEGMRLYPPVYELFREPVVDDEIGGYRIPAGTTVSFQQWVLHRDPSIYEDPETFRPDRWTEGFERELPPFAYFPFGGGPRRCVGERFAMLEATLILATMLRKWSFDPVTTELSFSPSITLRPAGPVELRVRKR